MLDRSKQIPAKSLSLGLERLGFLPLYFPILILIIAFGLSALAWVGVTRLQVDDSLSELFRSDSEEFKIYERMAERFPSSEYDVLIVIESPNILTRDNLNVLADLMIELNFIDSMSGLVSLFSARQPPKDGKVPPPLFPAELPTGEAFQKLVQQIRENEIIKGKLLSDDGTLALVVVALDRKAVARKGLKAVIGEIRKTVNSMLEGTDMTAKLSGAPVMQLEIRNAVERDKLLYNGIGFAIGIAIAFIFLRRFSLVIIAALPPVVAILWSLGTLGWLGFKLNLFLNVMSPLIMVIALSDSMQITFAIRDRLAAGDDLQTAIRYAVLVVVPAALITLATTAASFIALMFSSSALIRTFGIAGALSTVLANIAVIMLVPLLALLLLQNRAGAAGHFAAPEPSNPAMQALRHAIGSWTRLVLRLAFPFSVFGLAAVATLAYNHFTLEPKYRLADQVPDREQALSANVSLDKKLTGAKPVHVLIDFPKGKSLYDPETLELIAKVHNIVTAQAGFGNVWSVETLREWLRKSGDDNPQTLKQYIDMLPAFLTRRFISVKEDAVVVTGRIPDIDAKDLQPILDSIEAKLAPLRQAHPDYRIAITGLAAIAARNSAKMITQLNWGLVAEMLLVSLLVGLAFRSMAIGAISVLPGFFPVFASGTLLALGGEGLQFASIVALIVAFGLGLSATIHYLNRLQLEDRGGSDSTHAILNATMGVGPALVLTSIVLACGLAVTIFSDLPSLRQFGKLCAVTIMAALAGDLIILPAIAKIFRDWLGRPLGNPTLPHPFEPATNNK